MINLDKERIEIPIYFSDGIDFESIRDEFNSALNYLYEKEEDIIKQFNGGEE